MAALTFVHKGIEKAELKGGEKDEDHAHLVVKVRQRNLKRRLGKASKKIRNIFSPLERADLPSNQMSARVA